MELSGEKHRRDSPRASHRATTPTATSPPNANPSSLSPHQRGSVSSNSGPASHHARHPSEPGCGDHGARRACVQSVPRRSPEYWGWSRRPMPPTTSTAAAPAPPPQPFSTTRRPLPAHPLPPTPSPPSSRRCRCSARHARHAWRRATLLPWPACWLRAAGTCASRWSPSPTARRCTLRLRAGTWTACACCWRRGRIRAR